MKNKKTHSQYKNFRQRVAKLSEQYSNESAVKPIGFGFWARMWWQCVSLNMSWPRNVTKKLGCLRLDFLVRLLQKTQQFQSKNAFRVFVCFFFITSRYKFFLYLLISEPLYFVFRCQCTNRKVFVLFFAWILLMVFRWKLCLWKALQFLYSSCNEIALILHLHMLTLQVKVTGLQGAEATTVEHTKPCFLVSVLQSFQKFSYERFFQFSSPWLWNTC